MRLRLSMRRTAAVPSADSGDPNLSSPVDRSVSDPFERVAP
jgi:hypothetical protein